MDIEKLEQLGRLRDAGAITPDEFAAAKAKLLNSPSPPAPTSPPPSADQQPVVNEQLQLVSALTAALQSPRNDQSRQDQEEEYEVNICRSSTIGWLFGSLSGWGMVILCIAPLIVAANLPYEGIVLPCVAVTAIFLFFIFLKWIENISSKYEITNQRLIIKRGIIIKSVDEIELFRVKDIFIQFSLLGQMMNIGSMALRSSDNSGNLVMRDIPNARHVRETLRGLVMKERQRKRVREIDEWY